MNKQVLVFFYFFLKGSKMMMRGFSKLLLLISAIVGTLLMVPHLQVCGSGVSTLEVLGTLPSPRSKSSVVYDGGRRVYLIGGEVGDFAFTNEIVQFNLETNEVNVVGRLPPHGVKGGSAFFDPIEEEIWYFGGHYETQNGSFGALLEGWIIRPYNSSTDITHSVNLTRPLDELRAFYSKEDRAAYVIGNPSYKLGLLDHDWEERPGTLATYHDSCVKASTEEGDFYIFAGYRDDDILRFNASSGLTHILSSNLPLPVSHPAAVWDGLGDVAWIVGGWPSHNPEVNFSGMVMFSPRDNNTAIQIGPSFPFNLKDAAAVFVEDLNTIYLFGGNVHGVGRTGDILAISLQGII